MSEPIKMTDLEKQALRAVIEFTKKTVRTTTNDRQLAIRLMVLAILEGSLAAQGGAR